ncbi:ABC transporter ATP-binding protein [Enterovirga rhinocerotis]|uniref:Iron complex transport system ATP-binding protein n=1 Tax=Enterovirga rhinocerotis TaxID=1339210 RepID=A0A4V3DYV6_9HYPH|nr:ABC transporter ATP-binding protein [Enterovirga rhinocerotis]TDR94129.1 iron complex transport system ATP-binding protein [Enterovirga rhinocerotis]
MTTPVGRALAIENLSAGYGGRPVLDRLSIAGIEPRSVVAIVGPNGAGKSTLLRVLAGLMSAQGRARLGEDDLLDALPEIRAARIGFMPQRLPAGIGLSVIEGVVGALRVGPFAGTTRQVHLRAASVLERLGITHLALETLDRLSGGQRQMASLAQALAGGPALLLLDEPTSALDLRHQLHVMDTIRSLADEGRIVIVVLHDLQLAAQWADRIVVLRDGRLHTDAPPEIAITPTMLAEVYGVEARIERCSRGRLQIMPDALAGHRPRLETRSGKPG